MEELVDEYLAVRKKLEEERARLMARVSQIDEVLGSPRARREPTAVASRAALDELRKLESFGAHDVMRVRGVAHASAYVWLSRHTASGSIRRVRQGLYVVVDASESRT